MGIVDLKTNLKSLRFGRDTIGGGSSGQPFVKSSINSTPGDTGGVDFLLRANTIQRVFDDESRLFQLLTLTPQGRSFTVKQNLLSRIGVKSQASGFLNEGAYLPTSTLAQVAAGAFGGHLNKQGINPLASTTAQSPNTGNSVVDNILGFDPLGLPSYVKIIDDIKGDNEGKGNRLIELKNEKLGKNDGEDTYGLNPFSGTAFGALNPFKNSIKDITGELFKNTTGISAFKNEILRYGGGPGSILGAGQTAIRRIPEETITVGSNILKGYYTTNFGVGNPIQDGSTLPLEDFRVGLIKTEEEFNKINNSVSSLGLSSQSPLPQKRGVLSKSPSYNRFNIESRINLGNPGKRYKDVSNYDNGLGEALDKLTALRIYKSNKGELALSQAEQELTKDLVKFKIGIIDNKEPDNVTYIHFRAFIDSFSDNYSSNWDSQKFMGRGEDYYKYQGFDRKINLGWTVVAQSKDELMPMYEKLNYLASTLAPSYSEFGYMGGNIATLTVGNYVYEQPGIITSLGYDIPETSPWEINLNTDGEVGNLRELPHMIKVSGFSFTPIHKFTPQINNVLGENGQTQPGSSRFLSQKTIPESEYQTQEDEEIPKEYKPVQWDNSGIYEDPNLTPGQGLINTT